MVNRNNIAIDDHDPGVLQNGITLDLPGIERIGTRHFKTRVLKIERKGDAKTIEFVQGKVQQEKFIRIEDPKLFEESPLIKSSKWSVA